MLLLHSPSTNSAPTQKNDSTPIPAAIWGIGAIFPTQETVQQHVADLTVVHIDESRAVGHLTNVQKCSEAWMIVDLRVRFPQVEDTLR